MSASDIPPPPGAGDPPPGAPPTPPPGDVPPPPAAAPSTPPPGGPQVDIGAWFKQAWKAIESDFLQVILAFLVYYLILNVAFLLCVIPGLIIMGPLTGGLYIYCAKRLVGGKAEIGDIFKGFRRFVDTLMLSVVLFLLPVIFLAILIVPFIIAAASAGSSDAAASASGLFGCFAVVGFLIFVIVYPVLVGTFCVFAFPLVMFRQMGAIDALKASIELVKPRFMNFLLLMLINVGLVLVAQSVGSSLCIGQLILVPMAQAMIIMLLTIAYRDFVGLQASDLAAYEN